MSKQKYQKALSLLSDSGIGVILTRTREPLRAISALRELSQTNHLPFCQWDVMRGWRSYGPNDREDTPPKAEKITDPFMALKAIEDIDNAGMNRKESGLFVMSAIHHWMGKHPGITECLRHYVKTFAEKADLRLVLVCPESTMLPEELQHDIPIVDFDLPDHEEIKSIYEYILASSTLEGEDVPELYGDAETEALISSAGGMTTMQAEAAYSLAIVKNRPVDREWHDIPFSAFNGSVLDSKTEAVKQSEVLELLEPVEMSDVGGLEVLKEWITDAAQMFSKEARDFGADMPDGIAAVGPPGTGKTLVAKAIATTLGQPLVKFDVSKCFGKYVGESESKVRSALKQLEAMGRVVVLFDEVDKSLGGSHQGGGDNGVSQRVLGSILTFLQETSAPIFPVFTANRTNSLPPELLRKGRLDEVFAVMPPNSIEREAILKIHLRKRKQTGKIKDLGVAVAASRGYVSAELEAAVKEAVKHSFCHGVEITGQLIAEQLLNMVPISVAFAEDFAAMQEWAANNARQASAPCDEDANESIPEPKRARRRAIQGDNNINSKN